MLENADYLRIQQANDFARIESNQSEWISVSNDYLVVTTSQKSWTFATLSITIETITLKKSE